MRRLAALGTLALTGCWPYVSGDHWDDVYVPENVQILGAGSYSEYAGGYWEDGDPDGSLEWGWLAEKSPSASPLDFQAPQVGCTLTAPGTDALYDLMGDVGAEKAFVSGPGENIELQWIPGEGVFFGKLLPGDAEAQGWYDLVPLETENEGKFAIEGFMQSPGLVEIDTPVDYFGDAWPTGTAEDLSFTWKVREEAKADWILARIHVANETQQILETVYCAAEYGRGELVVNPDVFSRDGVGWFVLYGPARITKERIAKREVSSSMIMTHYTVGYLGKP